MKQFIDIHSHMLSGVDDGAACIDDSLKMLQNAYKSGTKDIILTPHYHPGKKYIDLAKQRAMFIKLKKYVSTESPFNIYEGNEIYYTDKTIQLLESGLLVTLADSCYVLVEFSIDAEYTQIENAVRALQMAGYWCVIAHVERYSCLRKLERVEELIQKGAYIQINSASIGRPFDLKNSKYIKQLLESEMIHFIASDAHDLKTRTPNMKKCYEWLCKKYGECYADQLLYENAAYILRKERL